MVALFALEARAAAPAEDAPSSDEPAAAEEADAEETPPPGEPAPDDRESEGVEEPGPDDDASPEGETASEDPPSDDEPGPDELEEPPTPDLVAPEDPDDAEDLGAIDDGPEEGSDEGSGETSEDAPEGERLIPPRFDGPYVGVLAFGSVNFAKVLDLDTPRPLMGGGGMLQAGDAVFPWMSIGIAAGGQAGAIANQKIYEGSLLVEFAFVPVNRYPFSIRAGFGFGGGVVREAGVDRRFGFGGALFKGSIRYEFFPLADNKRPDRGGGWAIGPELGWLGATPAGKGQPFVNTVLLGLSTSFYFGS